MQKKVLLLLSGCVLAATSLGLKQGQPEAQATVRDNDVFFESHGLTSIKYEVKDYRITSGQPYEGVTSSVSKTGEGMLRVRAGRSKSAPVASWFKAEVGSGYAFGLKDNDPYPKELNFALKGPLIFGYSDGSKVTCDNLLIAQGSFSTTNNWWLGGREMSGGGASRIHVGHLTCKKEGALVPTIMVFSSKDATSSNRFNANPQN